MNKWIILFATVIMTFVLAYAIPTVISNPSTSNLLVVGGLTLITIIGFWTFIKASSPKKSIVANGKEPTPIE